MNLSDPLQNVKTAGWTQAPKKWLDFTTVSTNKNLEEKTEIRSTSAKRRTTISQKWIFEGEFANETEFKYDKDLNLKQPLRNWDKLVIPLTSNWVDIL